MALLVDSLTDLLVDIETVLNAQSLDLAKNMFDFDNVPDSTIEKTYRYMISDDIVESDQSSGRIERQAYIEVEVAFNVVRGNFTNTDEKAKVALAETYYKALYVKFCNRPFGVNYRFLEGVETDKVITLVMDLTINYEIEVN